jgi:hypothetical protein
MGNIERFQISKITLKESFYDISRDLGISDAEIEMTFELAVFWENQGHLEVYEEEVDRQYGREVPVSEIRSRNSYTLRKVSYY